MGAVKRNNEAVKDMGGGSYVWWVCNDRVRAVRGVRRSWRCSARMRKTRGEEKL